MSPFVIKKRVEFNFVKLMDANGQFHDKVYIADAKDMAKNSNLDLVCFNEPSGKDLAFCKIIDFGKFKYNEMKSKKKAESHSKHMELKEIRFSPSISEHDTEHKLKQVFEFIEEGHEVLLRMTFKGIHRRHMDIGEDVMKGITESCLKVAEVVNEKKIGNQICVRLKKKKK
jgi:translation initiation factor IF-3